MESYEQKPIFNIQASLEHISDVSDVKKVELDTTYFTEMRTNLAPDIYENIKTNSDVLDAYQYKYLSDGLSITGFLWIPKETKEALPLIIWNRGGTGHFGSTSKKGEIYSSFGCELAKQGAIVVGSEYRGGIGSEGEDEWGGTDLHDVIKLKEIADQLPLKKSGKVVVAGASRGGMMSYLLASKEPWVKAVISLAGVTDLHNDQRMSEVFEKSFGGGEEEIRKRSAVDFYYQIPKDIRMLIMHGDADDRVSVEQARKLNNLLADNGYAVEYHEFANAGHYFYRPGQPQANQAMEIVEQFIKKELEK